MSREALRLALCGSGAMLAALGLTIAALIAADSRVSVRAPSCVRYPLVAGEWVCGRDVFLVHDGHRYWLGPYSALAPMPAPPQVRR